ncbi:MAG: helix-turn-helix domain-containing protein [Bacteroidales bacterium]|nr:helix-turn-helix domain-containing protein [Bacteroidales bacterium]MCF8456212.1 helix-turn-helix domain-containing protein [Bacteroidales bacterium]
MKAQIQKLLNFYQLSVADFAKIVGVNASGLSHLLGGNRNYLSIDTILKIMEKYPAINLDWLILGKGEMLIDGPQSKELFPIDEKVTEVKQEIKAPEISIKEPDRTEVKPDENLSPIRSDRKVKKIVLFYSDNSFEEFESPPTRD